MEEYIPGLRGPQKKNNLGKFLKEENILPKEVKDYLTEMYEIKKSKIIMDLNRYLNSLPIDERQDHLNDIYEFTKKN